MPRYLITTFLFVRSPIVLERSLVRCKNWDWFSSILCPEFQGTQSKEVGQQVCHLHQLFIKETKCCTLSLYYLDYQTLRRQRTPLSQNERGQNIAPNFQTRQLWAFLRNTVQRKKYLASFSLFWPLYTVKPRLWKLPPLY